jgi:hypothetical protein
LLAAIVPDERYLFGVPSSTALTPAARAALRRAEATPLSYGVRVYACPEEAGIGRVLVVLGEAHLKLAEASALGKEVLGEFELRGVESFQARDVFAGGALGLLIHAPRVALRRLTFGLVKDSSIVDAKQLPSGYTVQIERTKVVPLALHVASAFLAVVFAVLYANFALIVLRAFLAEAPPVLDAAIAALTRVTLLFEAHAIMLVPAVLFRRHSWSWLFHPAIAIVSARDELMAEGTMRMLADHPEPRAAIVVMGRAHLPGYERRLVERFGFRRIEL